MKTIYSFIPNRTENEIKDLVGELESNPQVEKIYVPDSLELKECEKIKRLSFENFTGTDLLKRMATESEGADYILLVTKETLVNPGPYAVERLVGVAEATGAGMVYSDYMEIKDGILSAHPLIDYQEGSLRDDFNFGPLVLYCARAFREAVREMTQQFSHAGLYYLRLKISQKHDVIRIPEFLYTIDETDIRKSGQKMFDYVDPKNRQVQIEMEQAVTEHLKNIDAWMKPEFAPVNFAETEFAVKASVIIPVLDREKTIVDAIQSVLNQKTNFGFNLLVVDNHSTDRTTELIRSFSEKDERVVHLVPERNDLCIGGCWNLAVHDSRCGMFAVQLDSDDIYTNENTLQRMVDAFYRENCAMVVGTYQLVNFKLEEIPPGIIDHREWTPDNGRNNALRINGLGAPRAFYTLVLREIKIPNVSYGEDYAVGLAISRDYRIGRVYENVYLCRRWDDNSDAALDIEKMNKHNLYKDRIRTIELKARQRKNK